MSIFNETIAEEKGQELQAYVSKPKSGTGPGIILMHEVYGVTKGLTEVADHLAENGFVVACPNMYWRQNDQASFKYDPPTAVLADMKENDPAAYEALQAQLKEDRETARDLMFNIIGNDDPKKGPVVNDLEHLAQMQRDVISTVDFCAEFLRNSGLTNGKVAASGFCFGGRNTYLAMTEGANVDAGMAFYPTPRLHDVFDTAAAAAIDKPMAFVYGGKDGYVSLGEKRDMRDAAGTVIRYAGGEDEPLVSENPAGNPNILTLAYTGSDHGFNRRESKYSDPGASNHVLASAVQFFDAALNEGKMIVPDNARFEMPKSELYLPKYKV